MKWFDLHETFHLLTKAVDFLEVLTNETHNYCNNNFNKDCYGRFSLIIQSNQHILVFLQFQTFGIMFDAPIKYYTSFK